MLEVVLGLSAYFVLLGYKFARGEGSSFEVAE